MSFRIDGSLYPDEPPPAVTATIASAACILAMTSFTSHRSHASEYISGTARARRGARGACPFAARCRASRILRFPSGVRGPVLRPPCIRQRPFLGASFSSSQTAGARQGSPSRRRAPHLGLSPFGVRWYPGDSRTAAHARKRSALCCQRHHSCALIPPCSPSSSCMKTPYHARALKDAPPPLRGLLL